MCILDDVHATFAKGWKLNLATDERIVLTLDAGGTNFVFSAIQSSRELVEPVRLPSETQSLELSLKTIDTGFRQVIAALDREPTAISFAFPGPADYPSGIIDNVSNLPAFSGGVPLGPWLERKFGLPVFINNDGNLFVYGEAIAGLLPAVNRMFAEAASPNGIAISSASPWGQGLAPAWSSTAGWSSATTPMPLKSG